MSKDITPPLTGRARSLANLRRVPKGVSGNPAGFPGAKRRETLYRVLLEADDDEPNKSRIETVIRAMAKAASAGDAAAGKLVLEQFYGRAPVTPSLIELAEHFRQIEADSIRLAIALLGDRVKTMTSEEIAAHLQLCRQNADSFIRMAKETQPLVGDGPSQVLVADVGDTSLLEPAGQASPKDRDTADHAPTGSETVDVAGVGGAYSGENNETNEGENDEQR